MPLNPSDSPFAHLRRRAFIASLASGTAGLLALGLIPKGSVALARVRVPAPAAAPHLVGLRIGFASDIHLSARGGTRLAEQAAGLLDGLSLDILALGGDYVTKGEDPSPRAVADVLEIFGSVRARIGRFAVPGNHDLAVHGASPLRDAERMGIVDLTNRGRTVSVGGGSLRIAGVDDHHSGHPDVEAAFGTGTEPVLLLTHNPDLVVDRVLPSDRLWLTMAGHLHGGQVRLPFVGPVYTPTHYPELFDMGLIRLGDHWVYVSSGVGTVRIPLRIGAPAEAVLVDVVAPEPLFVFAADRWPVFSARPATSGRVGHEHEPGAADRPPPP